MSEPYVGEIRIFAGNFAPRGWAYCDGQLLAVNSNDALFSLFGTIYGGDGRTTFGLPDLRGRLPIHQGTGPGLSPRKIGSRSGGETVTLTTSQIPSHTHQLVASGDAATSTSPVGSALAKAAAEIYVSPSDAQNLNGQEIKNYGGSGSHSNMMPYLCVHFIVALAGVYPPRN